MLPDERVAVVFSLEFIVGVRMYDVSYRQQHSHVSLIQGTLAHAQTILVGWGAAMPYSSGAKSFYLMGERLLPLSVLTKRWKQAVHALIRMMFSHSSRSSR